MWEDEEDKADSLTSTLNGTIISNKARVEHTTSMILPVILRIWLFALLSGPLLY